MDAKMSDRDKLDKKVMHLERQKLWLKAITVTAKPKSKEMANPEFAVPKKPSGCFKFDDGTTQNWTLDQLYDASSKTLKKTTAYFPFDLHNSQNLALAAFADPLIVTDTTVTKCDIYFDSPDLSSNKDWQGIKGYSVDVYRTLASGCWGLGEYMTQMQVIVTDTTDNSVHTYGEHNGDFIFHPIKHLTPYHLIWKPSVLLDPKYKIKQLRIRMTMPGYVPPTQGFAPGECAPKGRWLIGNVCPEK